MSKMIIIIDLHCDASMPAGAFEFGGGNKYSKNLLSTLLAENISFLYFTHKKWENLEEVSQLAPNSYFYRLPLNGLGINDKEYLQNYKDAVIAYIKPILEQFSGFEFIFHSIYWSSGEIAYYFSQKYNTFFVHTVLSNGETKKRLGVIEDLAKNRCQIESFVYQMAKYIICSSDSEATDIHKYYNIPENKLIVTGRLIEQSFLFPHYNSYGNPHTYSFGENMPIHYLEMKESESSKKEYSEWWGIKSFIFVGRIHKNKGIAQIIKAWSLLYLKYKETTPPLWIVGGTPQDIEIFRKSQDVKFLEEVERNYKIVWWGTLSSEGISTLMLKGLAFIAHSKYEAGGNVILEAMAHSLPVIATPYGYAKDYIINNQNGYLVSYNDILALSLYMEYFIKQPYLSNYLGRLARKMLYDKISNWDFGKMHLQLYGNIMKLTSHEVNEIIPQDSVDIYPYNLIIPDNNAVYEIIINYTNIVPISIHNSGNIKNYFLWEIHTLKGNYYFYFLYSVINWNCIYNDDTKYVLTKYQRIKGMKKMCLLKSINILYSDELSGYILLDQKVEI